MYRKLIFLISFIFVLTNTVKADLVNLWRLDETSGTIAHDASGNGHDGTLNGGPIWAPGKIGGALSFDGFSDQADHTTDPGNINWVSVDPFDVVGPGITMAAWIRPDGFDITDARIITKQKTWSSIDIWWMLSTYTDGTALRMRLKTNDGGADGGTTTMWSDAGYLEAGVWSHVAATYDGSKMRLYHNGVEIMSTNKTGTIQTDPAAAIGIGNSPLGSPGGLRATFHGLIDELRIYNSALREQELIGIMQGQGYPFAFSPDPPVGALHMETWVTLSWSAGDFAVSHDLYMGDNFDDVNEATRDSDLFRTNLIDTFTFAGFSGSSYPDQLVPGATYYWRIDEVNDAEPNSPWKGEVWSFSIPSKTAYEPVPADGAEFVDLNVELAWTPGLGAKVHKIVFGDDIDAVSSAEAGTQIGPAKYTPGPLKLAKTYYWRVDESDGIETVKGEVWSFTTEGAVSGPNPADGDEDVSATQILTWDTGAVAESHEVYFGTDADAVKNATTASSEYKGPKALGEESYDPGILMLNTAYYWRIDEVNGINPDSPWAGKVWSFTTSNYFVIDDFEDYDSTDNQIWFAWHDGLGAGTPGTQGHLPGNGTGSAVGDETTASYTEETIVNGGLQSMPVAYDNNKQGYSKYSEVEYTLTDQRDWTEECVTELSLWFRGYPASTGSFVEGPVGTYTMTGSGTDIWNNGPGEGKYYDEFHFAYKMLIGAGSIIAKVESVENTNGWAKAGVMIRETLDGGSKHAFACVTPANGVAAQGRPDTGAASSNTNLSGITAPHWVKLERSISGLFTVSHSADGSNWQPVTGATALNISMGSNVYIGLALTSHDAARTCQAVFSNVMTTGNVTGQWTNQDIGILSNYAEPLYVAVSNTTGNPAVVVHDDTAAAQIDIWTEWVIPLSAFIDQGVVLTDVDRIAIGLGTRGNMTVPGGSGKMFFDDIRLYQSREAAE
jgi:hypothetical protein